MDWFDVVFKSHSDGVVSLSRLHAFQVYLIDSGHISVSSLIPAFQDPDLWNDMLVPLAEKWLKGAK